MHPLLKEYLTNKTIENRNKLVLANKGLILKHVRQIRGNYDYDELINQLIPRMIRAIETYDPSEGTELSTWIHMYLKHELIKMVKRDLRHNHEPLPLDIIDMHEEDVEFPDINLLINNQHLLNEQQRFVLSLILKGMNGIQISQIMNLTNVRISQIRKEIAKILRPVVYYED